MLYFKNIFTCGSICSDLQCTLFIMKPTLCEFYTDFALAEVIYGSPSPSERIFITEKITQLKNGIILNLDFLIQMLSFLQFQIVEFSSILCIKSLWHLMMVWNLLHKLWTTAPVLETSISLCLIQEKLGTHWSPLVTLWKTFIDVIFHPA